MFPAYMPGLRTCLTPEAAIESAGFGLLQAARALPNGMLHPYDDRRDMMVYPDPPRRVMPRARYHKRPESGKSGPTGEVL